MSSRRGRPGLPPVVVLWCLAVVIGACTPTEDTSVDEPAPEVEDVEPSPQVGAVAAVVLPPRSRTTTPVLDAIDVDLRVLESGNEPELGTVRTLIPDEVVFVRDLALYAGQRAADLTCVLGPEGPSLVDELATLRPAARYCAIVGIPPEEPPPSEIDLLIVRAEELGHVVGMATAALPGERFAIATATTDLEGERFVDGFVAGLGQREAVLLDDEDEPSQIVARALADDVDGILVGSGHEAAAIADAARAADIPLIGPQALADAGDDEGFAVTWGIRWDRILQPSVDRLVGRSQPRGLSLGFSEGIFDVRSPVGSARIEELIEQAIAEIGDGTRDPLQPPAAPDPPEPTD
ncbi:MAG: hypothetical protein EA388_01505 [Nitriliruptor sp.]|nr:MAG: hypothetical protein EA388_01505 [Nitriliruptor sp.]